jgi:hypothetical protein
MPYLPPTDFVSDHVDPFNGFPTRESIRAGPQIVNPKSRIFDERSQFTGSAVCEEATIARHAFSVAVSE